jgi:heme/copper-type cytochrome/quinol oxidase subunit 2
MQNNNQLAMIALVAALALLGVVVVTVAVLFHYKKRKQDVKEEQPSVKRSMLHMDVASAHRRE